MAAQSVQKLLVTVVVSLAIFSQIGEAQNETYNRAVNLISVEREPTSGGNNFTVRFTKIATDQLIFRVQDNIDAPRAPSVVEEADGVWAASFVAIQRNSWSLWFVVGDTDFRHMVAISLDNSETTPVQQNITELPVIHLSSPSEAVYEPQEDIIVTAFVPRNSQTGEVISNFQKMFSGVDLNTMKMYPNLEDDNLFTLGQPQESADKIQASMTVHTSIRPVSGYLQLSTDVYNTGGTLAQYIQVSRTILIRPSSQAGPFPSGYLTILDGYVQYTSPNGNELHRCRVGDECLYSCVSVGESVTGMSVKEVRPDGLRDVPSAAPGPAILSTSRDIYWKFQAHENSGNSNGVTTFQCEASDATQGKAVTKLVDVQVSIPGSIDPARSSVTEEDSTIYPGEKSLTFHCAIRGRPLPDVVFYGGSTGLFRLYYDSPTNVIRTGPDEAIATKSVTVSGVELAMAVQRISEGRDSSPFCSIYSDVQGNVTSYDFYPTLC
ncbi:hypothetical protein ElyMa_006645100 [Elysia marginata]|uniref:Ig-like domain-containing protein n=1 Tax=Elysia marginata TaxID=1093978 RepID=A0AAV4IL73_9GAST|nr:hypothetical protein ElyMa_006645100 [Elysia marginata]